MKLRITQSGFQTYNGQMGLAVFENGLSVDEVPEQVARRLSGVIQCEWEDGTNPSVTQAELTRDTPAPNVYTTFADVPQEVKPKLAVTPESKAAAPAVVVDVTPGNVYTQEELEAIADAKGIAGLREIAEPVGIKSNSISGLIKEMIAANVVKG
jgi:hypothetical protein